MDAPAVLICPPLTACVEPTASDPAATLSSTTGPAALPTSVTLFDGTAGLAVVGAAAVAYCIGIWPSATAPDAVVALATPFKATAVVPDGSAGFDARSTTAVGLPLASGVYCTASLPWAASAEPTSP